MCEHFDVGIKERCPDHVQGAVLVHDVEVVDYREGVEARFIPVPVRLKLDEVPDRPLVAGWSANVTVDVTKSGTD